MREPTAPTSGPTGRTETLVLRSDRVDRLVDLLRMIESFERADGEQQAAEDDRLIRAAIERQREGQQ